MMSTPTGRLAKKMLRQPRFPTRIPPRNGPPESPAYTAATLMPSTFPLSCAGKTEVRMAMPVPNIIALPMPCSTRQASSMMAEVASPQQREKAV